PKCSRICPNCKKPHRHPDCAISLVPERGNRTSAELQRADSHGSFYRSISAGSVSLHRGHGGHRRKVILSEQLVESFHILILEFLPGRKLILPALAHPVKGGKRFFRRRRVRSIHERHQGRQAVVHVAPSRPSSCRSRPSSSRLWAFAESAWPHLREPVPFPPKLSRKRQRDPLWAASAARLAARTIVSPAGRPRSFAR